MPSDHRPAPLGEAGSPATNLEVALPESSFSLHCSRSPTVTLHLSLLPWPSRLCPDPGPRSKAVGEEGSGGRRGGHTVLETAGPGAERRQPHWKSSNRSLATGESFRKRALSDDSRLSKDAELPSRWRIILQYEKAEDKSIFKKLPPCPPDWNSHTSRGYKWGGLCGNADSDSAGEGARGELPGDEGPLGPAPLGEAGP